MVASGLAIAALTAVAVASTGRLLVEPGDALGAVVTGLFVHGLLRVADARRWGQIPMTFAMVAGLVLVASWTTVASATVYGVPTPESMEALIVGLQQGMIALRTGALPALPGAGVEVVAVAAAAVVAISSDRLAFANRRPLTALLPAVGVLAMTSALGDGGSSATFGVAFVVAAVGFLLASRPVTVPWGVVRAGVPLMVVAALVAPTLGPALPGARADGLVAFGDPDAANRDRVAVSPLLGVRDLLTIEPVEVFTVGSARPAYWRLTSLGTYDEGVWKSNTQYRPAHGRLPSDATASYPTESLTQYFAISRLAQFWLPAAYRPVSVTLPGARVSEDSLGLITDEETAAGLTYTVESALPRYGPGELEQAGFARPPEEVTPFLLLPEGLPADFADLAQDVGRAGRTPYERALALQNFFRNEFEYSTETPAGHTEDHLREFLFRRRAGYCEQFASAFALMARWLGLPSRVAVGFTPGTYDPGTGVYRVTSTDAHAWPEVYLEPYGWVPFEPTPTRYDPSPADPTGTYNADLYTIHVEPGGAVRAEEGSFQERQVVVEDVPPSPDDTAAGGGPGAEVDPPSLSSPAFAQLRTWVLGAFFLVIAVAAWIGSRRYVRLRRRRRLGPQAAIVEAWADVGDWLRLRNIGVTDADTPREVVERARVEAVAPIVDDLASLAGIVEMAVYGADAPGPADAEAARHHGTTVVAALRRRRGRGTREAVMAGGAGDGRRG